MVVMLAAVVDDDDDGLVRIVTLAESVGNLNTRRKDVGIPSLIVNLPVCGVGDL